MASSSSSNIPLEIIEIILSKSPSVKSLLRFKSVCKSWNTLISDPVFVRNHLENSPNNLFLSTKRPRFEGGYPLFKLDGRKFRAGDAVPIPPTNSNSRYETVLYEVLCECNGVLLLGNSRFHYSEKHVLWNPSTRREMYIECPYAYYNEAYKLNCGICYDRLTDDFKVVLVIGDRYAIYSCKNNSWSEKKLGIEYHGFFTGIFVDGATYWVLRDDKYTIQIVYFDPRTDELKGLQKPEQMNSDCNCDLTISVACLRENMCLYSVSGEGDDDMLRFRIWRKEKGIGAGGNPNWEELLAFEIRKPRDWWLGVLCFVENKILIRLDEKTFVYYSPTEKTFEEIDGNEAHNLYSTYCSELVRYRNSLYFPVQTETRSIS